MADAAVSRGRTTTGGGAAPGPVTVVVADDQALMRMGFRMVLDAELKPSDILDFAMLISDPERQAAMARAAASTGVQDAAARLAALIRQCASIHDTPTDEENAA